MSSFESSANTLTNVVSAANLNAISASVIAKQTLDGPPPLLNIDSDDGFSEDDEETIEITNAPKQSSAGAAAGNAITTAITVTTTTTATRIVPDSSKAFIDKSIQSEKSLCCIVQRCFVG